MSVKVEVEATGVFSSLFCDEVAQRQKFEKDAQVEISGEWYF